MSKKEFKAENNISKEKSKNKGKSPFQKIVSGLNKQQIEKMEKHSK